MPNLLIELFSEEIPARMQARAAQDLQKRMTDGLVEAGLTYGGAKAFSTPRRLTLAIEDLLAASPTLREERKGPRVDAPEKAIEGFLRGAGLTRDQLEQRDTPKGAIYFASIEKPGRPAAAIVAEVLEDTIRNFPWPKSMRWGAGSLRWVRPLHSILCILSTEEGAETVPFEIDGITAGNTTRGHRFMGAEPFAVTGFDDYAAKLKRAHVILDAGEREGHILQEAQNRAFAAGFELVEDRGLLAEVAGLVEWPVVLMGEIGEDFLALPPEVLQTSMKEHQKFFSVRNPKTGRIERFITVANIETPDHGATILAGNQKVLAARLSDAKFFWENDLRTIREKGLEGMAAGLSDVTFHNKLGSQADRIKRIEALAREIAPMVGAKPDLAAEAARVAKADLQSEMVGEFPELQGLMGRYYAEAAGHDDGVPEACEEHYKPLGPGDAVPTNPVSVAVALADKIDTLTGFWAIDEKPTGSKDPYALRRAALGVIRLVLGNGVRFGLEAIMKSAFGPQPADWIIQSAKSSQAHTKADAALGIDESGLVFDEKQVVILDLLAFLHDRLKVHLRDEGIRHDVIDACLVMEGNDDLTLLVKRAEALADFLKTDDGDNLLQGFKRANNILTQAEENDGVEYSFGADVKFADTPEEKTLFTALDTAEPEIASAMQAEDFAAAMAAMARLRAPTDAFFEAVQVNAGNEVLRRNRLNLLSRIRTLCLSVADLTRIQG
ncbi:glycine--tRNA ligase subunit beta [Aquicoccus porphyridii]|uniref:Glycine--tRNA ligase beta subunit n=1 Tax=Aquicoccus porphyridii TaxID=1852029 RepID=A0A5A9Z545_9RHOB|nr:glycine--tRNA ligase subunit beta [Aquicoccus porphyridii]KAA0912095.1 glycine--tRNA ligase subunit beta [Aquicoccus porphyridii]RAI53050.1 glycine--tRNA ligase subunit beta [Rhodobacteraceae bacterium AsT-22]